MFKPKTTITGRLEISSGEQAVRPLGIPCHPLVWKPLL